MATEGQRISWEVARMVEELFEGRKGHGGQVPARRRVLGRIALGDIIRRAFQRGREYQQAQKR